jgi:hypothetical protein
MNEGINLLPSQAKFRALRSVIQKKINLFMGLFGSVVIVASLVVIGFLFFSHQSLVKANNQYEALNMELRTMSDVFATSWGVKYRAKIVGKLLDDRFEYGNSIERVNNLFSKDISVSSMEIIAMNDFLINAESASDEGMMEIENMIELVKKEEIDGLENLNLLSLSKVGSNWKFKLEVQLK